MEYFENPNYKQRDYETKLEAIDKTIPFIDEK